VNASPSEEQLFHGVQQHFQSQVKFIWNYSIVSLRQ
jgi:hypothetical protein